MHTLTHSMDTWSRVTLHTLAIHVYTLAIASANLSCLHSPCSNLSPCTHSHVHTPPACPHHRSQTPTTHGPLPFLPCYTTVWGTPARASTRQEGFSYPFTSPLSSYLNPCEGRHSEDQAGGTGVRTLSGKMSVCAGAEWTRKEASTWNKVQNCN